MATIQLCLLRRAQAAAPFPRPADVDVKMSKCTAAPMVPTSLTTQCDPPPQFLSPGTACTCHSYQMNIGHVCGNDSLSAATDGINIVIIVLLFQLKAPLYKSSLPFHVFTFSTASAVKSCDPSWLWQ